MVRINVRENLSIPLDKSVQSREQLVDHYPRTSGALSLGF